MTWFIVYIVAIVLVIPCIIYGSYATTHVQAIYNKYSRVGSKKYIASVELAQTFFEKEGIDDVSVAEINGNLTDCYDSKHKVVKLSSSTIRSTSIAALGVTAHELGHVMQDHKKTFLFRFRTLFVPFVNFVSRAFVPLLVIGSLFSFTFYLPVVGNIICWISVGLYALSFIFYLITLPLEYNASKRAIKMLTDYDILDESEIAGAKSVLKAAISTYFATFATSFVYFIRALSFAIMATDRRK